MIRTISVMGAILAVMLPVAAKPPRPRPSPPTSYEIRFRDHLNLSRGLALSGSAASQSLSFSCESRSKPVEGSALHLFLEHSHDLDGNRSFLSISLNYGILRSIRLDEANEKLTEVIVPLPPNLLKLENDLMFSAEQVPASGERHEEVRTTISPLSYIVIQFENEKPVLDLSLLPSPLLDPYSYQGGSFDVLLAARASSLTLEATALLAANFSSRLALKPVSLNFVRLIQAARHPLLIAGTPTEQPELWRLAERSPFLIRQEGGAPAIGLKNGEILAASEGVAALLTRSGSDPIPILVVTGSSPQGVLRTARYLLDSRPKAAGSFVRVSGDIPVAARRPRDWKGFIPPGSRFTLADLSPQDLPLRAQDNFSLLVPLLATPDSRFLLYGHQMVLLFRLEPWVQALNCKLIVEFNQARLGEFAVQKLSEGSLASVRISIPAQVLQPQNYLKISLAGPLEKAAQPSAGFLLRGSQFYLPRDFQAQLPDLGLLQFHLYPFTLTADLADTVILLPPVPGNELIAPLVELSALIGKCAPTDRLAFTVRRLNELTKRETATSHFIFLYIPTFPDLSEQMFLHVPRLPRSTSWQAATVQETVSPWNAHRFVLNIGANSPEALRQSLVRILSETTLRQLRGDAAYVTPRGTNCYTLARQQSIGQSFYLTHLEAWLRANWLALPIILAVVSGILFVGSRLALAHYRGRRAPFD